MSNIFHDSQVFTTRTITDKNAKPYGTLESDSKKVTYASRKFDNWESILCTTGLIDREELRVIYATHGIHRFLRIPNDDVVYANKSFVAIHSAKEGQREITFPHPSRVTQLLPIKRFIGENLNTLNIDLPAASTTLFLYE